MQSSIGVPKNIVVGCIALHVTLDVVLAFRGHDSWTTNRLFLILLDYPIDLGYFGWTHLYSLNTSRIWQALFKSLSLYSGFLHSALVFIYHDIIVQ